MCRAFIPIIPLVYFYTPWKYKKTGFRTFSEVKKRDQWHEIGYSVIYSWTLTFQKCCFYLLPFKNDEKYLFFSCFLEIFTFLPWLFGYVEKWLDMKAVVNFKFYDVLTTNNYNTLLPNYWRSKGNKTMKFGV